MSCGLIAMQFVVTQGTYQRPRAVITGHDSYSTTARVLVQEEQEALLSVSKSWAKINDVQRERLSDS